MPTIIIMGQPEAKARHRTFGFISNGKAQVRAYTGAKGRASEQNIIAQLMPSRLEQPLEGPVYLDTYFFMKRPKSHYRTGKHAGVLKEDAPRWCTSKPDIDNLRKNVMDALTKAGFWRDDAQVAEGRSSKRYADELPNTVIQFGLMD